VEEAATMVVAEAVEDNYNKQESNVAMVTVANNDSNRDSGSRGNDDNGGGGESDGGKKITIN
jgi:hypothetical protein